MRRFVRIGLLAGLLSLALGSAELSAQTPVTALLPSTEAQAFLGAWALAVDADGQTFNLDLVIEDNEGTVAGEVSSEFGSSKVTRFERSAEKLVLGYSADMNGESVPIVITLDPTPEGVNLELDFGQGTFVSTGKGTKK